MNGTAIEKQSAALCGTLDRLNEIQDGLYGAIEGKLEAMRRLDTRAMGEAARSEATLAADAARLDETRREQVKAMCEALGFPRPASVEHVTLRLLCRHMPPETARTLWQRGEALRERMLKVAEANRVVELVTREMMAHFKTLFAAFVADDEAPRVYSRGGAMQSMGPASVLDAVG